MNLASARLLPAVMAVLTAVLLLTALDVYARHRLKRGGTIALAALNLPENTRGIALPHRLLLRPRSLLVYGSSEMDIEQPTRADLFFHGHQRSGFQAFVIGQPGDRCLVMLQELAALGEAVRGKKVAIFLSPVWFTPPATAPADGHADHRQMAAAFSPLQTGRTLLSDSLRPATRQAIASQLLSYDNVLQAKAPLLHEAAAALATPSWINRCRWWAVRPLLAGQTAILAWQDRYHQLELLRARPRQRANTRPYRPCRKFSGWDQLLADVTLAQKKLAAPLPVPGIPPSMPKPKRSRRDRSPAAQLDRDEDFLRRMDSSPEWEDLELLLQTLHQLKVRPLLINQPINGLLSDRQGITPAARRQYYDRIKEIAARHRVALRDFSEREADPEFFCDAVHPSAKAWVLYDEALAAFCDGKRG